MNSNHITPDIVSNRLKLFMKKVFKTGKAMANIANISEQAFSGYMQGKNLPASVVLASWAMQLNLNLNWLLTGEGAMFRDAAAPSGYAQRIRDLERITSLQQKLLDTREELYVSEEEMLKDVPSNPEHAREDQATGNILSSPVPVVGLAACGLDGIEQIMPYNITASPIALGPYAVAVVASGESMVPAGIASGHLCFCDPDQKALPGEAVFLRRKDDKGALKLFLGKGKREGFTAFKGWLPEKDEQGHQKVFIFEMADGQIDCIAPVIFIRRRL